MQGDYSRKMQEIAPIRKLLKELNLATPEDYEMLKQDLFYLQDLLDDKEFTDWEETRRQPKKPSPEAQTKEHEQPDIDPAVAKILEGFIEKNVAPLKQMFFDMEAKNYLKDFKKDNPEIEKYGKEIAKIMQSPTEHLKLEDFMAILKLKDGSYKAQILKEATEQAEKNKHKTAEGTSGTTPQAPEHVQSIEDAFKAALRERNVSIKDLVNF